jgi:hypothetical protein
VTADAYTTRVRFWDRVNNPEPSPIAHAFSARPADAEIRTFFPAVTIVARRLDRAPLPDASPVALACGDVGADGSVDIVVVGRRRVVVGRLSGGRFVSDFTREWSELSPVAPSPLREPLGTAAILPNGALDVALSDRASGFRLDRRGASIATWLELYPWPGGGCASRVPTGLDPNVVRCTPGDEGPTVAGRRAPSRPVDAIAGAAITGTDGAVRLVRAERFALDDSALIFDDTGRSTRLAAAGAQIAIGDLDGDGTPELLASKDTLDRASDSVDVYSWGSDSLTRRMQLPIPAGVRAVAVCPWLGDGMSPLVVATSSELVVVR